MTLVLFLGGLALYSREDFQALMRWVWDPESRKQTEPAGPPAKAKPPEPPKAAQTPKSPARGTTPQNNR